MMIRLRHWRMRWHPDSKESRSQNGGIRKRRPDFDDVVEWCDKVWDEPLLLQERVYGIEERRPIHDSIGARAFAMWEAAYHHLRRWHSPLYSMP